MQVGDGRGEDAAEGRQGQHRLHGALDDRADQESRRRPGDDLLGHLPPDDLPRLRTDQRRGDPLAEPAAVNHAVPKTRGRPTERADDQGQRQQQSHDQPPTPRPNPRRNAGHWCTLQVERESPTRDPAENYRDPAEPAARA